MKPKHFLYIFILSLVITGWFVSPSKPEPGVFKNCFLPGSPRDIFMVFLWSFGWILVVYFIFMLGRFTWRKFS